MRYQLDWRNSDLVQNGVIQDFADLHIVRTENTVGSLKMTLAQKGYNLDSFRVGQYLEVWREKGGVLSVFGETAYFVQDFEFYSQNGEELVDVYAKDLNMLLETRIVAAASSTANAEMKGKADDLMKAIVRNELGINAHPTRRIPGLTVQADVGQSAEIARGFAYGNVLDVLRDMANSATEKGIYTSFDLVRTGVGKFEFRTYTGQRGADHRRTSGDVRLVGENYGNLENPRYGIYHGDEWNYVYCGGRGEKEDREISEVWDLRRIGTGFPYNRKEYFRDSRHQETKDGVDDDAYNALNEGKPKTIMTGNLIDTPGMMFGRDYQFGDVVSAEAFGQAIDCHISSVAIRYDAQGGETLDIKLRGERENVFTTLGDDE